MPPPPEAIWKTRKAISASRMTAPIPAIQTTGLVSSSGGMIGGSVTPDGGGGAPPVPPSSADA